MFGQLPDFTNGFEFLRKLWASGSGMPSGLMPGLGSMAPPMNLDDIDKRIHDLKAVESWLQLNTNLLRTTIQGLEVQRATLVALQTFGNALSPEAMQNAMENVARAANAPSATPPHHYGTGQTVSEAQADRENDEPDDEGIEAPPEAGASAEAEASASAASAGPAPVPPNASLWWDLLQQQFSQIASSAAAAASVAPFSNLGNFGAQPAPGNATEPAPEPAPKPDKAAAGAANGNGKARPAAKKAATKPAAKPAATKPAARKPAVRKAPAGKTAAGGKSAKRAKPADPDAPPTPGTPEDTFE
ncbi:PhaM family polyhydroxyalkanoate granule multifunctional regulatory protein [Cupriavidus sp. BIS7]|uniref:PhaM family polyhydroxyalkanoate granule multifunctional regulatory protein n=1 Tax=Cupriavidus sp. BIS7 TaxID=1217718 RepID=UPI0002DE3E4A|nr:PhaM family polyhydroxyalkanoate granule multifunctional regulatory protein [Cupriavidus sp. BIS7]